MFRVGQKVVCVDALMHGGLQWAPDDDIPKQGNIYTVLAVRHGSYGTVLDLHEIRRGNSVRLEHGADCGYGTWRFRPIVERKSKVSFTTGADPESECWDNRKPVPARKRETAR